MDEAQPFDLVFANAGISGKTSEESTLLGRQLLLKKLNINSKILTLSCAGLTTLITLM
jgi:hypothetical protein